MYVMSETLVWLTDWLTDDWLHIIDEWTNVMNDWKNEWMLTKPGNISGNSVNS